MRFLLIADRSQAEGLLSILKEDGLSADICTNLDVAGFKLKRSGYQVVLIVRKESDAGNVAFLQRWRRDGIRAHVVLLLPRTSGAHDRAACLDAGADACLTQPVSNEELRAYLRALHRREHTPPSPVRRVHDLEINTAIRTVSRGGRPIHLTPREFDLLHLLADKPGKVVSRSMILERLYDDKDGDYSNVIAVYIRYLRGKIDKDFDTPLILTRWGQGYLLRPEGA